MSTVKAAAVQLSPVLYSREGTVAKVVGTIHDLAPYGNEPALAVARDLDAKVESLLETAAVEGPS